MELTPPMMADTDTGIYFRPSGWHTMGTTEPNAITHLSTSMIQTRQSPLSQTTTQIICGDTALTCSAPGAATLKALLRAMT